MKQYSYSITTIDELTAALEKINESPAVEHASSILFQVFSCSPSEIFTHEITAEIKKYFPRASVIGCSTSGEIVNDHFQEHTVSLSACIFSSAMLYPFGFDCSAGREKLAGQQIMKLAGELQNVKGLEIFSDTKTMDNASMLAELSALPREITVFGGGADAYNNDTFTAVFNHDSYYTHGVVGVFLCGSALHIKSISSLGWKPLGMPYQATGIKNNGAVLTTIGNQPAISIYEKYLSFKNDLDFHEHVDIFPLMVNRSGYDLARVPIACHPDGSIDLGADVKVGENIRLAYADPNVLMESSFHSAEKMAAFQPEGILLFSCITRRGFLKEYSATDAEPFSQIAPTAGFSTYGEIFRLTENVETMNCTLVCAGIREGEPKGHAKVLCRNMSVKGHMSAIERLVSFVEATTADLEEANQKLQYSAGHDRLTKLLNRGQIEQELRQTVSFVERDIYRAAGIMMDIDDFKKVNDTYGHAYGDYVLQTIAEIIRTAIRKTDQPGRWGGEEFMIVLPATGTAEAVFLAERVRRRVEQFVFEEDRHITVSIGVSEIHKHEELMNFYQRVDNALYQAKAQGKNKVVAKE